MFLIDKIMSICVRQKHRKRILSMHTRLFRSNSLVDSVCFTAENNYTENSVSPPTKHVDEDVMTPPEVSKMISHQRSRSTSIVSLADPLVFTPTPNGGIQMNMYGYFIDLHQVDIHEYDRESSSDINSSNSTSRLPTPLSNLENTSTKTDTNNNSDSKKPLKHKRSLSYNSYEPYDNNTNKNKHKRHISYVPPKITNSDL